MSVLFTPVTLGDVEIKNRFVQSATYECMAARNGMITDNLVRRYVRFAEGGVGLSITGYMYVHPSGRAMPYQTGIDNDDKIEGLKNLADAVHAADGRIVFQLAHAGRQTTRDTINRTPMAPSKAMPDSVYMTRARAMTPEDIREMTAAFGAAAARAAAAGADGVQVHAAHGFLVNQFLSPFFNRRSDAYGGSDENRFRFLKEIVLDIRKNMPADKLILVKMNTQDYTPRDGIDLDLAQKYAEWLAGLKIDGLEVSCGTLSYSMFNMVRGNVPTEEIVKNFAWWRKFLGRLMLKKMEGRFDLEEGYNDHAAEQIKPVLGRIPLLLVGGLRRVVHMEELIENGTADVVSMSRPFIREPNLVKRIETGQTDAAACVSCNKCFAAAANDIPVYCYNRKYPG